MTDAAHIAYREQLEQRYGFAEWGDRVAAAASAPVLRFAADPHALPGMRLQERSALPDVRGHIDHLVGDGPGREAERIAVTVVEHVDVAAAHEHLIELLGQSMLARLPSCADRGLAIGDVCFCTGGDPVAQIYFTRANVFVRVESTGDQPTSVAAVAEAVDGQVRAAGG